MQQPLSEAKLQFGVVIEPLFVRLWNNLRLTG